MSQQSIRIAILGHSGIGKSPLSSAFKVEGWEPFRVRKPRNEQDSKVCKSPEEYEKILSDCKKGTVLYESPQSNPNRLRVYDNWSFFEVRGAKQCLQHMDKAKDMNCSLRIEIFAPVLLEILENVDKIKTAFYLDPSNLIIIMLNPASLSFKDMPDPSLELSISTIFATTERSRIQGKGIDLSDSLKRVGHLKDELSSWRNLFLKSEEIGFTIIECKEWSHFEFRYSTPGSTLESALIELIRTRETILSAIGKQANHMLSRVEEIMRTPKQISELSIIT